MSHVHTNVAGRAAHFNVSVPVIDGHRRSQVGHADVTLLAMNRNRRLLRYGNVQVHADSRASAAHSGGPYLKAITVLHNLRGNLLAHFFSGVLIPALHANFAGYANLSLVRSSYDNVAPYPAHRNARIRWHGLWRHVNAAGKCFMPREIEIAHPR